MVYELQIATAKRLIAKYGEACTYQTLTNNVSQVLPWEPGAYVSTETDINVVFQPLTRKGYETLAKLTNLEVSTGHIEALFAGSQGILPQLQDIIIRAGVPWKIISIEELAPNGEQILYTALLIK